MEASRLLCESLTSSFDTATTEEQKATIVNQWDRAMKECNTLELALAILEKQAREAGADPGTGI
jgi:hypothetical protein